MPILKKFSNSGYYISMVNRGEFSYRWGTKPDNILEIRVCPNRWAQVKRVAGWRERSYSWVVRYCVFRFIRSHRSLKRLKRSGEDFKQGVLADRRRSTHDGALRQVTAPNLHRHRLCLYGDDELYIRVTAAALNFTMTHLVRLALEWNLDRLEGSTIGRPNVFHSRAFCLLGVKLYTGVDFPIGYPEVKQILLHRFPRKAYW